MGPAMSCVNSGQFACSIWDGDRTRCGEFTRRVVIVLSVTQAVGLPATSHTLVLTGRTEALVLGKTTAKTHGLGCRSDNM
jgi:hypothetical protein